ncbi:MAG: traD [Rickettsiaceae bacterium]|jgi:type IV conjugative transfer system coupling protein TraD|nr:traD [Rickettsiaceae bacterium]
MIGSSIRGGQILVHQYRMLKQIFKVGCLISFTLSVLFYGFRLYSKLPQYDYAATYSYFVAEFYNNFADSFKNSLFSNREPHSSTINAYLNNDWNYSYKHKAKTIAANFKFIKAKNDLVALLKEELLWSLGFFIIVFIAVFSIWYWYGRKTKEHEIIKGTKIYTAKEVAGYLGKKNIASDIVIGDMPLVKDSETSHILVTGTTGSGKSNLFNTLLPQIIVKKQPAIVIDLTGDMIARFYDPKKGDIIFNPFDARSHGWDLWNEVSSQSYLNIISNTLYTSKNNGFDDMWNNSSKIVFNDCIEVLGVRKKKSIKDLYSLIALTDLKDLSQILKGTPSGTLLDPNNAKTAMSIRTNTIAYIEWMKYLTEKENNFTLRTWVRDTINNKSDNWLFLSATPEQRKMLIPLFSVMSEVFMNALMELGSDYQRRIWLIMDELPAIKKLPSLPMALSEFRKYGGCIFAGLQSMNQLTEIYGYNEATTMFGQFNIKFIFRTEEQNIANMVSALFGKVEYQESSENISYGAHEMRDGVSFGKVERTKPLVSVEDLASLANLECFIKLPDPICRIAKINMDYKDLKKVVPSSVPIDVGLGNKKSQNPKNIEMVESEDNAPKHGSVNLNNNELLTSSYNISGVSVSYKGLLKPKVKENI